MRRSLNGIDDIAEIALPESNSVDVTIVHLQHEGTKSRTIYVGIFPASLGSQVAPFGRPTAISVLGRKKHGFHPTIP
jgi:hypothetical protein